MELKRLRIAGYDYQQNAYVPYEFMPENYGIVTVSLPEKARASMYYLEHRFLVADRLFSGENYMYDFWKSYYTQDHGDTDHDVDMKTSTTIFTPKLAMLFGNANAYADLCGVDENPETSELIASTVGEEATIFCDYVDVLALMQTPEESGAILDAALEKIKTAAYGKRGKKQTRDDLAAKLDEILQISKLTSEDQAATERYAKLNFDVKSLDDELKALQKKDDELKKQEHIMQLLAIKNDYENLLKLRERLKTIEQENASNYEKINAKGREITIHELTKLSEMLSDYKSKAAELNDLNSQIEQAEAKYRAKQKETIVLSAKQNAHLSFAESLAGIAQTTNAVSETNDPIKGAEPFAVLSPKVKATKVPVTVNSLKHLKVLPAISLAAAVLCLTAALIFSRNTTVALILFTLALLLGMAFYFLETAQSKRASTAAKAKLRDETNLSSPKDPVSQYSQKTSSKHLETFDARAASDRTNAELQLNTIYLRNLLDKISGLQNRERSLRTITNMVEKNVLRELSNYAEVDDIAKAEGLINSLMNQNYRTDQDLMASDVLRSIADIKQGRSDADMLSGYEKACEELYGSADDKVDDSADTLNNAISQKLYINKNQLVDLEAMRLALSAKIDALSARRKSQAAEIEKMNYVLLRFSENTKQLALLWQGLWREITHIRRCELLTCTVQALKRDLPGKDPAQLLSTTLEFMRRLKGLSGGNKVRRFVPENQEKNDESFDVASAQLRAFAAMLSDGGSELVYAALKFAVLANCQAPRPEAMLFFVDQDSELSLYLDSFFTTCYEFASEHKIQVVLFTTVTALKDKVQFAKLPLLNLSQEL